jgi:hypothetical protein
MDSSCLPLYMESGEMVFGDTDDVLEVVDKHIAISDVAILILEGVE